MKLIITPLNSPIPPQSEVAAGLSAQPGGQAGALGLTMRVNIITNVAANTGVRLAIVNNRYRQEVINRGGATVSVFPPTGHNFTGVATNVAIPLENGQEAAFTYRGGVTWDVSWAGAALRSRNLSDIADPATAWANLGGGAAGKLSVGAGLTVAAGVLAASVLSVAGRTGAVTLSAGDITGLGAVATLGVGAGLTSNGTSLSAAVVSVAGRTGAITLSAADVVGLAASATTDTTSASNISSGTLSAARLPTSSAITWSGVQSFTSQVRMTGGGGLPATPILVGSAEPEAPGTQIGLTGAFVGLGNGHGFSDNSSVNLSNGAYCSYDADPLISGISSGGHYAGFQSRPTVLAATSFDQVRMHHALLTMTAGTVNDAYAYLAVAPSITGAASVTNYYGLYVGNAGNIAGIANPWGVYVAGDPSFFGDHVGVGIQPAARLHVGGSFSAPAWGVSGVTLRVQAMTVTDTSSSGTVSSAVGVSFAPPTVASSLPVTYGEMANVWIGNPPNEGVNVTGTKRYSLVVVGDVRFGARLGIGGANAHPTSVLSILGNQTAASWTTTGLLFSVGGQTLTDSDGSGTIATRAASSFGTPTFASINSVTVTYGATVLITGAPAPGTGTGITNPYALFVQSGNVYIADKMGIGQPSPTSRLHLSGAMSATAWGVSGINILAAAATYTDTSSSGTVSAVAANSFATPTFGALSTTTYTDASNLYLASPAAGPFVTLAKAWALYAVGGIKVTGFSAFGGGNTTANSVVTIGQNQTLASWTTTGPLLSVGGQTLTDSNGNGTIATRAGSSFGAVTFASTNTVTLTNASTLLIAGPASQGTGTTITNAWAIHVVTGNSLFGGTVTATEFVLGTTGPTWSVGTGVPSGTKPKGSVFSRTDGGVGSTLYVSQGGGTWNAVAGV